MSVIVPVGTGWAQPVPSRVFAELVARSAAAQVDFLGDLWHDARTLHHALKDVRIGDSAVLYWTLRPSGCHLTASESEASALVRHSEHSTLYRITIREAEPGRRDWIAEFETLRYSG